MNTTLPTYEYTNHEWRLIEDINIISKIADEASYMILGPQHDVRDSVIQKYNTHAQIIVMDFNPVNNEMKIELSNSTQPIISNQDPVSATRELVNKLTDNSLIIIDITSLSVQAIFILLLELKNVASSLKLFATYVTPKAYNVGAKTSSIPNYILSQKVSTIKAIPGFTREYDQDKAVLFVTLGFEGGRFSQIQQYFENDNNIRPILPLPSYHAGWHDIALKGNIDIIHETHSTAVLERFPAIDPFRLFAYLQQWHDDNPNRNMVVAPIGTKPHALGVALLTVTNSDVVVVFDHPIPKPNRSLNVDKIWCYCLTGLI